MIQNGWYFFLVAIAGYGLGAAVCWRIWARSYSELRQKLQDVQDGRFEEHGSLLAVIKEQRILITFYRGQIDTIRLALETKPPTPAAVSNEDAQ